MPLPTTLENLVLNYIAPDAIKTKPSQEELYVSPEVYFLRVFIILSIISATGIYHKDPLAPLVALMAGFSASIAVLIKGGKITYNTAEAYLKKSKESRNWETARFFLNFNALEENSKVKETTSRNVVYPK